MFIRVICVFTMAVLGNVSKVGPVTAAQLDDAAALAQVRPQELIIERGISPSRRAEMSRPVDAFYGFWVNGSSRLLADAVSPQFMDHTLPPGRPQGPTGPATASKDFLAAVPDLSLVVVQRLVVEDRVVSHLRFTGHFTGNFAGTKGEGQPIDFIATDIVKVRGGKITDNWHLEDNLSFLRQIGQITKR